MRPDAPIAEIARGVACYLCKNPCACDGRDAIARWWLAPGHVYGDADIERAMGLLVGRGLVREIHAVDGRVRYAMREGGLPGLQSLCRTGELPCGEWRAMGGR
ncbi:MAG TPA: hypothetical protein VFP44_21915 [Usitatibacter sp.]|nr:hypothetical protein [Usitatibacter sp.]